MMICKYCKNKPIRSAIPDEFSHLEYKVGPIIPCPECKKIFDEFDEFNTIVINTENIAAVFVQLLEKIKNLEIGLEKMKEQFHEFSKIIQRQYKSDV